MYCLLQKFIANRFSIVNYFNFRFRSCVPWFSIPLCSPLRLDLHSLIVRLHLVIIICSILIADYEFYEEHIFGDYDRSVRYPFKECAL